MVSISDHAIQCLWDNPEGPWPDDVAEELAPLFEPSEERDWIEEAIAAVGKPEDGTDADEAVTI